MVRHLLRATVGVDRARRLALCLPSTAQAQQGFMGGGADGFISDPFNFYYAFYLPNQQMQSLRPRPIDTHQPGGGRTAILCTDRPPQLIQPDFALWRPDL